jgi:hypothetical protein
MGGYLSGLKRTAFDELLIIELIPCVAFFTLQVTLRASGQIPCGYIHEQLSSMLTSL